MHPLPFEAVQLGLDFGKLPLALGQLQIAHPFVPHVASAKLQVGQNILVVPWAKDATTHLRSQCSLIGCHLETAEQLHVVPAPIRNIVQHHPIAAKEGALFFGVPDERVLRIVVVLPNSAAVGMDIAWVVEATGCIETSGPGLHAKN